MKRISYYTLCIVLVSFMISINCMAYEFQGKGTEGNPYLINSVYDLKGLAYNVNSGTTYRDNFFLITEDIILNRNVLTEDGDLNGNGSNFDEWIPIGKGTPFCGTFDGGDHHISGIYINCENCDTVGLFGKLCGVVKNLVIRDSYIKGKSCVGGFCGCMGTYTFDNGKSQNPMITYCYNYGTIYGGGYCGGIVGLLGSVNTTCIRYCVNYGAVTGVQGICDVVAGDAGGIVGRARASISDCGNYGIVSGGMTRHGGIAGHILASVHNCFNFGEVDGKGIAQTFIVNSSNLVNYGKVSVCTIALGGDYESVKNTYYLATSGTQKKGTKWTNCCPMTAQEMKSQAFLDELNRNAKALGMSYSLWKFGKDGFPILEWIDEGIVDGIRDVTPTNTTTKEEFYSIGGLLLTVPQRGLNIIKKNDGTIKKIMIK